jgi:SAM-dependent methyltransferase
VLKQAADPFPRIASYYQDLVDKYGHDPRACDYGRAQSQEVKFRVLSEAMPLDNCSVLDVGCGFADLERYLTPRSTRVRYSGIDICPAMVTEALRINPRVDVRVANLLDCSFREEFDLVAANGILYLLGDDAWPLMQSLITRMFGLARQAVAFNSLSAWATDKESGEFYPDPLLVLEFCHTLTSWVVLRHDYHPRDFTIYMYKTPRT